jgi:HD-like signal output (HDOD) protein
MSLERNQQQTKEMVLARIPAFSPVVLRVLELLAKDDGDLVKMAREITADATLSAQLLRLANSALFGFACKIDTVQKAAVAVGNGWIQQLTVSVATGSYMKSASQTEELKRCWRHTLATAVLCRELAKAAGMAAERAYTVGLLHDIGLLGLLAACPAEYAQALVAADGDTAALLEDEKKRFAADHCEIGAWLMEDWHLPAEFCSVVGRHHEKPQGGAFDLLTVTQLASELAATLGYAVMAPAQPMTLDQVRSLLPEFARGQFPTDTQVLVELIEPAIASGGLQSMDKPKAALPPVERPVQYEPPRFAPPRNHPMAWGYAVAGIVVALGLAASVLFLH